jgi:hypothetical protein
VPSAARDSLSAARQRAVACGEQALVAIEEACGTVDRADATGPVGFGKSPSWLFVPSCPTGQLRDGGSV